MNREVREWFSDLGDNWEPDIATPRSSLRVGCTHAENDSIDMTLLRVLLFYLITGKGQSLQSPIYGIPTESYQQSVKFHPQIKLYFHEDLNDVSDDYQPVTAEITFRVMNETSESFTKANATVFANKIRTEFATGNGYRWRKGRLKLSYRQPERGYHLIIAAHSESEGKEVIGKVLDIQNHSPNWDYLTVSQLDNTPPTVPPTRRIYGEMRREPRRRPIAWVRFRWAELHLWGMPKAITLVDRSNRRRDALVKV
ncbi:hypothetical protein K9N68_10850 [Kovacikia minuta CCNUW1]|uniref:hypothetical protein n=1 Tax=Kovacikia minuta TaxID=2931930 RepID=UPI001CCB29B8|nr:hypothetical protein [Kovacikia minuta]UBF28327.1 hypothetical protein K9N68_10850 [Kovacikia minuta CCNUW1]